MTRSSWRRGSAPRCTSSPRTICVCARGRSSTRSRPATMTSTCCSPPRRSRARPSTGCSPRRASPATWRRAGSSRWRSPAALTRRGSTCTATPSPQSELDEALAAGVGHIVVDSFDEIERLEALAARARRHPGGAGARHPRRRRRHPRGDLDRPGRLEVRLLDRRRARGDPAPGGIAVADARRAALPHRLAAVRAGTVPRRGPGDRRPRPVPRLQPRRRAGGRVPAPTSIRRARTSTSRRSSTPPTPSSGPTSGC